MVSFEDTIKILKARGEFMQAAAEANPGAMLAVMNMDSAVLVDIAEKAGCYVANFNSTAQVVLSGTVESIDRAEVLLKEAGARRTVRLPVAGAFHSPLMQSAADQMKAFLNKVELGAPALPVLSNVTADVHAIDQIAENMVKQITSSVQWVASIQKLIADGVEEIVECGPNKVLAGLIKRIDKDVTVRNMGTLEEIGNQ